ncbi:MAG: beta-ketoacyl synthase [Flavobacterium sp.]|nr:beta-ketoacyl synthase [Flavobacterium sp.]
MLKEVFISDTNCITPLGFDVETNMAAIESGASAVKIHDNPVFSNKPFYGSIIDQHKIDGEFASLSPSTKYTHLEKMLILAMNPIIRSAPGKRTGLILSTTKGNVSALANPVTINQAYLGELAKTIADFFGFQTNPIVISNACVSGIMAIAVAKRLIQSDAYDDVYIVAGDEFSKFVFSGFSSFQALSAGSCQPYSSGRDGLNLGEAAAAVHITSDKSDTSIKILGDGAINDANHISGPSRTGEGLFKSIQSALKEAKIQAADIDYISAHGTATLYNDEMESVAFTRAGLQCVPVNSYKGIYGHTLGASGLLETVVAIESARRNKLYKSVGYDGSEMPTPINVITENSEGEIKYFMKTASGFGGCNTAVIFEKL